MIKSIDVIDLPDGIAIIPRSISERSYSTASFFSLAELTASLEAFKSASRAMGETELKSIAGKSTLLPNISVDGNGNDFFFFLSLSLIALLP